MEKDVEEILLNNKCNINLNSSANKGNINSPEFPSSMMEKSDVSPENSKKSDISSSSPDTNNDFDDKTKLKITEDDHRPQYQQIDNKSFDKMDKLVTMATVNQQKDNPQYHQQQYQHQYSNKITNSNNNNNSDNINNNNNYSKQMLQQQSQNINNEIVESNNVQSSETNLKNKNDSTVLSINNKTQVRNTVVDNEDDDGGTVELRHPGANNSVDSLDTGNDSNANDTNKVNQNLAFTIDFGNNSNVNTQKHRSMMERFQNRHRRGISMSKLEDHPSRTSTRSLSANPNSPKNDNLRMKPPMSGKLPRKQLNSVDSEADEPVVLRVKDKSSNRAVESSKRHSWSPRSSLHEQQTKGQFVPRSTAVIRALEVASASSNFDNQSYDSTAEPPSLDSSSSFTCPMPALENKINSDEDEVSDAGTYTIPDNNYTKEQKERMDIDKLERKSKLNRPNHFVDELEVIDLDELNQQEDELYNNRNVPSVNNTPEKHRKNILEVSFCHDTTTNLKPKVSYLDKLKSRFHRSIKSPDKNVTKVPDVGTFTSITTGGIFSTKPTVDSNPRMMRRNSLTRSQIDNSEYFHGISRLNINMDEKTNMHEMSDSIVDDNDDGDVIHDDSEELDDGCEASKNLEYNQRSAIKTATTKKDWVKEWAQNVREYSRNNNANKMTRSCTTENNNRNNIDYDYNMSQSDYFESKYEDEFGNNLDKQHFNKVLSRSKANPDDVNTKIIHRNNIAQNNFNIPSSTTNHSVINHNNSSNTHKQNANNSTKPPISPLSPNSRIPSPIHSIGRGRSVSRNRSLQGSNSDLSTNMNDTEMYLQKTAAAISSLQSMHRRNSLRNTSLQNSPMSPMSPSQKSSTNVSPIHSLNLQNSPKHNINQLSNNQYSLERHSNHRRNLSLDSSSQSHNKLTSASGLQQQYHHHNNNILANSMMSNSLNSDNLNKILDNKRHIRHNSYEGTSMVSSTTQLPPKPIKCFTNFDQTNYNEAKYYYENDMHNKGKLQQHQQQRQQQHPLLIKQNSKGSSQNNSNNNSKLKNSVTSSSNNNNNRPIQNSPIKRSTSFSSRPMSNTGMQGSSAAVSNKNLKRNSLNTNSKSVLQKSASSSSFKKMVLNCDDENEFYINDQDDLEPNPDYSFNSSDEDYELAKDPLSSTRYNKTFLMRMEQNKNKINANSSANATTKHGVFACPNTPEMPRRNIQQRQSIRDRASMPRDSSLTRMKQDLSNRKNVLTKEPTKSSTSSINDPKRVQPKYLDISKYKSNQGQNYLKRDESKSYLPNKDLKKSPSNATIAITRNDATRSSVRSKTGARTSKKDIINKQNREQELEMWRRRSSYDPMKAAAEGKKRQDEAKRLAMQQQQQQQSYDGFVMRSQSFHSGVGGEKSNYNTAVLRNNLSNPRDSANRMTLTSTESSDYDDDVSQQNS